jgi:hypothetical protein
MPVSNVGKLRLHSTGRPFVRSNSNLESGPPAASNSVLFSHGANGLLPIEFNADARELAGLLALQT